MPGQPSGDPPREPDPDARLMVEVGENDSETALRKLYETYRRPICKFFYNITYDYALAEDWAQEVFLRLWRGRKRYQPIGKFSTYLFQIAKNYWLNEKDKRDRRPSQYSLDQERTNRDGESRKEQFEAAAQSEPNAQIAQRERDAIISAAIGGLPEKLRMVFVLSQVEGLKYRQIAEILDIPEGTVKSRMSRAVISLRDRLHPYFGDSRPSPSSSKEKPASATDSNGETEETGRSD